MKKLSLLMFAILILGCDTETTVVEEPPIVVEEPPVVVEEPEPVVMEEKPIGHPLIARGNVQNGDVNVNPELLNSLGLRFELTQEFLRYWVALYDEDGEYLSWDLFNVGTDFLHIERIRDYDPLEYDTEYKLVISVQDFDCDYTDIVIQFRTKPQRPVVDAPQPVIQERTPVVPLGERFRFEPDEPLLVAGDVEWGARDVDPEPLNANGIHFQFHKAIKEYKIDLRLDGGASLGWLPRGLVENDMGQHIHIMPAEGFPLLEFDTEYIIEIFVEDFFCWTSEFKIGFRTKPKP